jgi:hypothetical protein
VAVMKLKLPVGKRYHDQAGVRPPKGGSRKKKIMDSVASNLKEGLPIVSTSAVVAKVITDFSSVLFTLFNKWQEQNQYQNVDPVLPKTYKELLIKKKITELEHSLRTHDAIKEKQITQHQEA